MAAQKFTSIRVREAVHKDLKRLAAQIGWRLEEPVPVVEVLAWAVSLAVEEFRQLPLPGKQFYGPGLEAYDRELGGELQGTGMQELYEALERGEDSALNLWRAVEKYRFLK